MTSIADKWRERAKRDDVLDVMVPSDIRLLIAEIDRLRWAELGRVFGFNPRGGGDSR